MEPQETVLKYAENRALFDIRCDYTWHRKFNTSEQIQWLTSCDAALVTYITKSSSPFDSKVVTQTVLKFTLTQAKKVRVSNIVKDVFDILEIFQPAGRKVIVTEAEAETHRQALEVVCWWHTGRPSRQVSKMPDVQQTECIKIEVGEKNVMRLLEASFELNGRAIFVHGHGPWLVTDQPIGPDHTQILLDMISKGD